MKDSKNSTYVGPSLHEAIAKGDMNSFEDLMSKSGAFGLLDSDGNTVVHIAIKFNRIDMLQKLAAKGAELNTPNKIGEIPLEIAFRLGNAEMVAMLISQGADINAKWKDGSTLLHNIAKSADELKLLDTALDKGAGIKTQDRRGNTPLHYAVNLANKQPELRERYTEIALRIINKVSDPSVFTQANLLRNTCLAIALKTGNKKVLAAMAEKLEISKIPEPITTRQVVNPKQEKLRTR